MIGTLPQTRNDLLKVVLDAAQQVPHRGHFRAANNREGFLRAVGFRLPSGVRLTGEELDCAIADLVMGRRLTFPKPQFPTPRFDADEDWWTE